MDSLATALLITLAALGFSEVIPALRPSRYDLEGAGGGDRLTRAAWRLGLAAALGFGLSGTAILIIGAVGGISFSVFATLTITPVILLLMRLYTARGGHVTSPSVMQPIECACTAIIIAGIGFLFWQTMMPDIDVDDITYHASVPKAWVMEGRIVPIPLNAHSNWHMLLEMSYLWSFALRPQDIVGAKLLEAIRCVLSVAAVAGFSGWIYGRRVALIAAACVLLMEEFFRYGTTADTDAGQALFQFTAMALIARWLDSPGERRYLALGSLLLGFSLATKHTGVLGVLPILAGTVAMRLYARRGRDGNPPLALEALALGGPMTLALLPWLGKNLLVTGNPVYPFFGMIFPAKEDFAIALADVNRYFTRDATWWEYIKGLPTHLYVMNSNVRLGNVNGILFLGPLSALLLILNRREEGRGAISAARMFPVVVAMLALPAFILSPFWRFMIGAYPIAFVPFAGEAMRLLDRRRPRVLATLLGFALLAYFSWNIVYYNFNRQYYRRSLSVPPNRPTLTEAQRRAFYETYETSIHVIDRANEVVGPAGRLLASLAREPLPMLHVRFIPNAPCISREAVQTLANWGWDADRIAAWMHEKGITHILAEDRRGKELPEEQRFRERWLREVYSRRDHQGLICLYEVIAP